MRVLVTITFDRELPLARGQTWVEAVDAEREKIEADPGAYLGSADSSRGPVDVRIKPL